MQRRYAILQCTSKVLPLAKVQLPMRRDYSLDHLQSNDILGMLQCYMHSSLMHCLTLASSVGFVG